MSQLSPTSPPETFVRPMSRRRTSVGLPLAERSRRAELATLGLLAVLVIASALAAGGVFPIVVMLLAPLAIAAALASTWIAPSRRAGTFAAFFIFVGLGAYTLLQTVPLPLSVLAKISPVAADVWARSLLPLGAEVHAAPLSLDPGATTLEALKWVSYACIFVAASGAARRRGAEYGAIIVFASAVLVAFVTLGHQVFEAKKLFGLYAPKGTAANEIAPFLNKNNLAAYLDLGAFVGAALLFSRRKLVPRSILACGIVVVMAVSLRSGSRAGVVTLLLGVLVLAALLFVVRSRRGGREAGGVSGRQALLLVVGTLVAGIGLALVGGDRGLSAKLSSKDMEKFHIPGWSKPMIWDFKWFGVGRGAFESVFSAYHPPIKYHVVFSHPENFVIQWLSEWGVVGAASMLALFWLFRPTRLGVTRSALHAGVTVGLAMLLLHNLADLSLELFGVGAPVALLLGSTWGDTKRRGEHREGGSSVLPIRIVAGFAVAVLALTIVRGSHPIADDRADIRDELNHRPVPIERVRSDVRTAMQRHPADYFFPMAGAMMAIEGGEDPIPWIQRALERGPYVGRTHLVLADLLSQKGIVNQALLELRLSVEYELDLAGAAAQIATRTTRDGDRLLRAVPDGVDGVPVLEAIGATLDPKTDLAARETLDAEALRRDPASRVPRERLVAVRLAALLTRAPPCEDRAKCEADLRDHAAAFRKQYPDSSRGDQILAQLDLDDGHPDDARARLDRGCNAKEDAPACLAMLAPLVSLDDLPGVMTRYSATSCSTRAGCAAAYDWIASTYETRKQWGQALTAREKAVEQVSTEPRLLQAADTAEKAGLYADAVRILTRVAHSHRTTDAALDNRIANDRVKAGGTGIP